MTSRFISYRQSRLHYRVSGSGPQVALCLHGFGEFARSFEPLMAKLPGQTLVALDLPWHGETEWNEGYDLRVPELLQIIRSIPELGDAAFGLIGFSMGGRICLSIFQEIPEKILFLLLIAPDGLKVNPWYRIATQTQWGNIIFRNAMDNPNWLLSFMRLGKKIGLVNESILKFVHRYTDDKDMRRKIYRVWTTMRKFSPALKTIAQKVHQHKTPVYLIFGAYDRIIPPKLGAPFMQTLKPYGRMDTIDAGHQLLHPRHIQAISAAWLYCLQRASKKESNDPF